MVSSLIPGHDLLGGTAAVAFLSLLAIWILFFFFKFEIRKPWIRLIGVLFTGITLSMLLGVARANLIHYGILAGGRLGYWVFVNSKVAGMENPVLFLSALAFAASFLLATDWIFIDYLLDALHRPSKKNGAPRRSPGFPAREDEDLKPVAAPPPVDESADYTGKKD